MQPHINFIFAHTYLGYTSRDSQLHPSNYDWKTLKQASALVGSIIRPIRREWPKYTSVGCYPLFYVTKDNGVLCPNCANKNLKRTLDKTDAQYYIVDSDINYEDTSLYCDDCNKVIESAYGDDKGKV